MKQSTDLPRIGFVSTVISVAADFEDRAHSSPQKLETVHVIYPWLLEEAIRNGVTNQVRAGVLEACQYLAKAKVDAILVTCSSIGEVTKSVGGKIPVLRVDTAMAQEAVKYAMAAQADEDTNTLGHITVLATLSSTLGPTSRLISTEIENTRSPIEVDSVLCEGAFAAKQKGDIETHDLIVAGAIRAAVLQSDVIVLAQATMASAITKTSELPIPVLTSPASAMETLLDKLSSRALS